MKINIKTSGVDLTPSFRIYVEGKFAPLRKFVKRFDEEGVAEVWVEVARVTRHHRHGDVFRASASVRLPKKNIRAEEEAGDARSAVDVAKDVLRLELEKYKERFRERPRERPGK